MASDSKPSLTRLLQRHNAGAPEALSRLVAEVYDELYRMARGHLRRERAGHTLDPYALVHEAYARLAGGAPIRWTDRQHVFFAFARAMRHVLCDHARKYRTAKRGGDVPGLRIEPIDPDAAPPAVHPAAADARIHLVLSVAQALEALDAEYPRLVRLVELRFFCGLSIPEAARLMNRSPRSLQRDWNAAKALLKHYLRDPD